ncbi:uncharacterized protein LOC126212654 [Schistocerca nitens]|uniref:uncharacterized protein LOC126212654 n=1 Tax=Schistocerca nitens TaxID=7011 RepID=UPI0021173A95|nr:uncharacterized protein LOC126212654 [Schistocerca nitens]
MPEELLYGKKKERKLEAGRSENKKENGCGQGERRRASCGFAQPAERLPVRSSLYWDCSPCDARCVCRHLSQLRQPTTRPAGVAASPLALLASSGASALDCVCWHVGRGEGEVFSCSCQRRDLDTPCITCRLWRAWLRVAGVTDHRRLQRETSSPETRRGAAAPWWLFTASPGPLAGDSAVASRASSLPIAPTPAPCTVRTPLKAATTDYASDPPLHLLHSFCLLSLVLFP